MDGDEAIGTARRLLRRRPGAVLPPFVAEAGMQAVLQAVGGLVALTALVTSRGTGRIDRVVAAAEELLGASTRAEVVERQATLREAVLALFTPAVIAVALLGVGVLVVGRAAVSAAKVHVARAAVRPETAGRRTAGGGGHARAATDGGIGPLTAAVEGALADTWRFAGVTLLRVAVLAGPALAGLALGGWTLTPLVVLLGLLGLLAGYVGFLFVGEAVVVDGRGPLGAVRQSAAVVRRRPARAALYVAVEVATYVALLVVVQVLVVLGVGRGVDLLTLFLVFPFLGLVRMGLYLPDRPTHRRGARDGEAGAGSEAAATPTSERRDEKTGGGPDAGGVTADGSGAPAPDTAGLVDDCLAALREEWRNCGGSSPGTPDSSASRSCCFWSGGSPGGSWGRARRSRSRATRRGRSAPSRSTWPPGSR